ncbi:MAG TPA: hypothetical protein VHW23_04050, partial [Kofleriaceae bacterium]|nr:hypothetical protein [Kofleriaceae bacterium]
MTRRWLWAALAALGGACGDTTTTGVTELNLDRPVDVSFACYGRMRQTMGRPGPGTTSDPMITTAMPTAACDALSPSVGPEDPMTGKPGSLTPAAGQELLSNSTDNPTPTWYAFILQSAAGTLALATWPAKPATWETNTDTTAALANPAIGQIPDFNVLDADPLTPGKNAISVGEDPVALVTDTAGCFEVTANAGSCDLSELDITGTLNSVVGGSPARLGANRVSVMLNNQPILARPSAMVVEPGTQTVGNACPAAASGHVYIAYPSCQLVAEVRLDADANGPTATVVGGIHYDDVTGAPSVITDVTTLSCPTECAPPPGRSFVPVPTGRVRPVALDYKFDPRIDMGFKAQKLAVTSRLAIGADITGNQAATPLAIVDLDLATFDPIAAKLKPIALEPSVRSPDPTPHPVSVSALALTPQIGMGGDVEPNTLPPVPADDQTTDQAQYIYAVATDGTVRVADVLSLNHECDTQVDGRFLLRNTVPSELECLQAGQPGRPRRSGARGPGIELPGSAVPVSVAIVKGRTLPPLVVDTSVTTSPKVTGISPADPTILVGYFAVIAASSGNVYVANIDDDDVPDEFFPVANSSFPSGPVSTSPVLVMAHQLRDDTTNRDDLAADGTSTDRCAAVDPVAGAFAGGPRLNTPPVQQAATNTLSLDLNPELPRLQQVACQFDSNVAITAPEFGSPQTGTGALNEPAISRDTVFPELKSVQTENWTLTYEGTLGLDTTINSVNGPTLRFGQAFVDRNGMFFEDASRPFCDMGIEPWDVVEFLGCNPTNGDTDCPADYTCYVHPQSTVGVGACLLKSEAQRLQSVCQDFLTSVRRYTVGTDANGNVEAGKLVLLQRKHELPTTPVDGCQTDDQCDDLARAAQVLNPSADPFTEAPAGTAPESRPTRWSCMTDPLRKPISTDPTRNKRCVQVCTYVPPTTIDPHPAAQAPKCTNGMVCGADPTSPTGGVCMEGIEPPQVCLNGSQRYLVHASEAFTVVGDHSGFIHPIVAQTDTSGTSVCVMDPSLAKNPLARGRIPLTAPACDPNANVFTGQDVTTGAFEANPCSLTVPQFEKTPTYPVATEGKLYGTCTGPTFAA